MYGNRSLFYSIHNKIQSNYLFACLLASAIEINGWIFFSIEKSEWVDEWSDLNLKKKNYK